MPPRASLSHTPSPTIKSNLSNGESCIQHRHLLLLLVLLHGCPVNPNQLDECSGPQVASVLRPFPMPPQPFPSVCHSLRISSKLLTVVLRSLSHFVSITWSLLIFASQMAHALMSRRAFACVLIIAISVAGSPSSWILGVASLSSSVTRLVGPPQVLAKSLAMNNILHHGNLFPLHDGFIHSLKGSLSVVCFLVYCQHFPPKTAFTKTDTLCAHLHCQ